MELAKYLIDKSESRTDLSIKINYRRDKLAKWQKENAVEIVKTLENGRREKDDNETTIFVKARYEFILLAAAEALAQDDPDKFVAAIEEAIETGKNGMNVAEPPKTYIRKQIQRDKSTFKRRFKGCSNWPLQRPTSTHSIIAETL